MSRLIVAFVVLVAALAAGGSMAHRILPEPLRFPEELLHAVEESPRVDRRSDDSVCRFAPLYSTYELYSNATLRDQFFLQYARRESRFCKSIGLDQATQMTYDGHRLDIESGLTRGKPHMFSAPSKESLHVAVLARVLDGHPIAQAMYSTQEALAVLRSKVRTMERFHERFPGFGGFYPWTAFDGLGNMTPTWDWVNRVPSLDNGELFWAAFALEHVLREKHPNETSLADSWRGVWKNMTDTALAVFYAGNGTLRTVTNIGNQAWPVWNNTYNGSGSLNDPYEGELFTVMVYLFTNLSTAEKHQLWVNKREMLQRVQLSGIKYRGKAATITVQKGFWFSAHEQWKYLMLPYVDSRNNYRVFLNGERARTWYATEIRKAPGLWASVNGPIPDNNASFPYYSDCGIGRLSFNPTYHDDVITPYGAFPLFVASPPHGIAWFHHMLLTRKAQNCWGTTESFNVTGTDIGPLTTWDSKITTVVAAMQGVADMNRRYLHRLGKLQEFVDVVQYEWGRLFANHTAGPLPGEELPLRLPDTTRSVPTLLPDFTTCNLQGSSCPPVTTR